MQLASASFATRPIADVAQRLDELGRVPLVTFDYRPIPSPGAPKRMQKTAVAIPAWTDETRQQFQDSTWDEFWAAHPAGAGRLVRLDAASYEDAVSAARQIALTTRPNLPPGDKQNQAVLQLADGSWWAGALGIPDPALQGVFLLRMGAYDGYWRPQATGLVPELQAVVGGFSTVDLRGKTGVPVQT
jgi:hypothetical protein